MFATNYDIENELRPLLNPGERFVWTGRPKTGIVFRVWDFFLIPFSLLWAGFAFFWEITTFSSGAPIFFRLWGIPFILVGLYITVGRFFIDAKKRAGTRYAVTNERIIIKAGLFHKQINSLPVRNVSDMTVSQKADNSGTITFGPPDGRYSMVQGMEWPGVKQPTRLELIENVQSVYNKILELQRQADQPTYSFAN